MNDAISTLRALTDEIKVRNEELRTYFVDLSQRLTDASGGHSINGESESCTLEMYGDDDAYYGYLSFNEEGLRVAYRTREDDAQLVGSNDPWEPTYSVQTLDKCSPVWLRALAAPAVIESLLKSISEKVEEELRATKAGIQTLSATANLPLRDLDAGLVDVAGKLNFSAVIQQWKDAQSALAVDPPDATTRASSLIETLSKHILDAKLKPVTGKESIQQLYSAATRTIGISPEQQVTDDLRAIAGGMNTLVVSIGALRTHAGTAHGKGPDSFPISFQQARLAVNAAGVLATFLMDALVADGESTPKAASGP